MFALARRLDPWWLLAGFLLNIPQIGLKALRWFMLVRWQGMRFNYRQAFLSYFGSLLIGFITPGRLGEMVQAVTLRNECGVPLARGLSSVILDRVFDMYLLLTLGSLGIVRFAVVARACPGRRSSRRAVLLLARWRSSTSAFSARPRARCWPCRRSNPAPPGSASRSITSPAGWPSSRRGTWPPASA